MGYIPLELSPADVPGAGAIEAWLRANALDAVAIEKYGRHAALIHLAEDIEEAVQGVFPEVYGHTIPKVTEHNRREHEQRVEPGADTSTIVKAMDDFYQNKGPIREETADDYRE